MFFWYILPDIQTWRLVTIKNNKEHSRLAELILLNFLDKKTVIKRVGYTTKIPVWRPINISEINIAIIGVKYEYKFCLNFMPANMHVANMGVKFGGWGINLEKARKKIDNIANNK